MINARGLLVVILSAIVLLAVCVHARAAVLTDMPCPAIRQAVAYAGGLDAAVREALARGYTEQQIERVIARCKLR